ncbi:Aste57867_15329 [Aphanomyces stellatus]|uniref:Aste57867_15329 protein n=1 Tax=Aphanomyces stellatus TaxID=120398 RepID=A0A485L3V3_9STRA|nr:hypothetical protein As57867_015273 [Aphanomyces stellatus]VFT92138.1 Aste57867_15329 [Aphanomyces stellatus]
MLHIPFHQLQMKLFTFVASLALVNSAVAQSTPTCSSLADPGNAMYTSYIQSIASVPVLKQLLPDTWLTCVGSLDPKAVATALTSSALTQPTCVASLAFIGTLTSSPSALNISTKDLLTGQVSDASIQALCTPLTTSLVPCINTAILPAVLKQINANACCAGMVNDIKSWVGETPDVFLPKLINLVVDVPCSTQAPGLDGAASQTCTSSWLQSVAKITDTNAALVAAVQVPNNQGCPMAQGNPFTTTSGATATIFTKPVAPGACVQPVDDLLGYVRKWPVVKSTATVSDLFEDGKCVKGSDVATLIGASSAADIATKFSLKANEAALVAQLVNASSCLHITNGGLQSCAFAGSLKRAVAGSSTPAPTTAANVKSGASLATASMVATTLALVSMF